MKKIISIVLAVCMMLSVVVSASAYSWNDPGVQTVQEAVEQYETKIDEKIQTNRYYFLMPNGSNGDKGDDPSLSTYGQFAPTWYNDFTDTAAIYWWDTSKLHPSSWIGYVAMRGDAEDIYYADVPTFVTGINWNNGVDGGIDSTDPKYHKAAESVSIGVEFYDRGESPNYPDGIASFDGMIYVVNPNKVSTREFSQSQICEGEWYYYYGDGHYGFVKGGEADLDTNCLRDDHEHTNTTLPTEPPSTTSPSEHPAYGDNTLSFDAESTGWKNFSNVYCHIWVYGGDSIYDFKAKKEKCIDNGDGTWTYDLDARGVILEDGVLYALLFGNENGMQTYNLLFDSSVIGDIAYCDGTRYEVPANPSKTVLAAFWKGQCESEFGPEMCITSNGNIVGDCVPRTTSAQQMFVDFLNNNLNSARYYSGKTDQQILDDTAIKLGITKSDIQDAIDKTGVRVAWSAQNSGVSGGAVLNFDPANTGWGDVSSVSCHIWEYDGDQIFAYGSKKEQCVLNSDGTWTYDLETNGVELDENKTYCVIFYNSVVKSTYNLLFDLTCFGDIAYCDGTSAYPNDTTKANLNAYWTNKSTDEFGPELNITREGQIIGECIPNTTSKIDILSNFIEDGRLDSTVEATNSTEQKAIDSVASKLGLYKEEVSNAIEMFVTDVSWKASLSTLPSLYGGTEPPVLLKGDVDGDSEVSILDATAIQRHLARLTSLSVSGQQCADVDGDDQVSILDATQIQRFLAKLIPEL